MTENLKPCPACGGDAIPCETFAACGNRPDCCLVGPSRDPDGAKWNALPRRTDASQGMDGFELLARAILDAGPQTGNCGVSKEVSAELDRRAAARKESK